MANTYSEVSSTFQDIADAIREKGITGKMKPTQMASRISEIETGITPIGEKEITTTDSTDVSSYATAKVVDSNLVAANIAKDVTILGITGTHEGGGGSSNEPLVFYSHYCMGPGAGTISLNALSDVVLSINSIDVGSFYRELHDVDNCCYFQYAAYNNRVSMKIVTNYQKNDILTITGPSGKAFQIYPTDLTITGYDLTLDDKAISAATTNGIALEFYTVCLAADTKMQMSDGTLKNIQDIEVGDTVKSWNESENKVEEDKVSFMKQFDIFGYLYDIECSNGQHIVATNEHMFYANNEWKRVYEMKGNEYTFDVNGNAVQYSSINPIPLRCSTPVYCIETEKNHTYFVGENGIVSHNY